MKILMINSVLGIGSTGRICTDIASALEKEGNTVKIAYGRGKVPKQFEKYAVKIGSDIGVKAHGLKARLDDASGFGSTRATKAFIKWIRDYNPDVIHLHNVHGYYINVEIFFDYLRTCGKKIIWTLHDSWAFTGHSAYCDFADCVKYEKGCENCPLKSEYPKAFVDRANRNWKRKKEAFTGIPNLTVVTPSLWLKEKVSRSFLGAYNAEVINNGIDTSAFGTDKGDFRKKYGLENEFVILGVAGVFDKMKGFDDYVKLSEMIPDNYRIVLIGLSKKQIEKLPKNVIGIERTDSVKQLAEAYASADILLNLSYCENYPTVNIEAKTCGTKVLSYNVGGGPETADFVVPKGDINALFGKLMTISEKESETVISSGSFDASVMARKYVDLYGNETRKKILFVTNIPSPYRIDFFNELGKRCNLTVCYERKTATDRDKKWVGDVARNFKEEYLELKPVKEDRSRGKAVLERIKKEAFDIVVFTNYVSPATMRAISYAKKHEIPFVMEYDGGYMKKDNVLLKAVKKYLISKAKAHLTTSDVHRQYLISLGIDRSRIYKYPFTSVKSDEIATEPKEKFTKTVLTVSRFIEGKGIPELLNAIPMVKQDAEYVIVGGNATDEYIELRKKLGLEKKVRFEGFKTKNELKEFYKNADFLVFPTLGDVWGLVVNEAMAEGLPVISTDMCGAAGEMIEEGKNGFVVPAGNPAKLAEKIEEMLECENTEMSKNAIQTAKQYTIEQMAMRNAEIFDEIC